MNRNDNSKFDESVSFVASRWRKDAFSVERAMDRLGLEKKRSILWRRVAAAAAGVVVLGASAALYFALNEPPAHRVEEPVVNEIATPEVSPLERNDRIEFTDAPLAEVAKEIERTYGVKVGNLPTGEYRLTLSYEGTATDLVATINELLDTDFTVSE